MMMMLTAMTKMMEGLKILVEQVDGIISEKVRFTPPPKLVTYAPKSFFLHPYNKNNSEKYNI
jgi:hypothetical protein